VFASNIPVKSYAEKEDHTCPQSRDTTEKKREEDEVSGEMNARSRREEETEQKREFKNQISLSRTSLITHHV
jgi:hypothetical protein